MRAKSSAQLPEDELLEIARGILPNAIANLQNKSIFLTGGTGLFGIWLLEFLSYLDSTGFGIGEIHILSRDPRNFLTKRQHLIGNKKFIWHQGDMTNFKLNVDDVSYAIHGAATSASETYASYQNLKKFRENIQSVENFLDNTTSQKIPRVMYISSGSVYGQTSSPHPKPLLEDNTSAPTTDNIGHSLGHAKRVGELLFFLRQEQTDYSFSIARCFSFVGPMIPLDIHYAVGNFLLNALREEPIQIRGDGSAIRSYMYLGDLVIWLLTILLIGKSGQIYNVGSNESVTILQLAMTVDSLSRTRAGIQTASLNKDYSYSSQRFYLPDISKANRELSLKIQTPLKEALERTLNFYYANPKLWSKHS